MPPLRPTKLEAGEAYASVEDILLAADLPEAVIRVPYWRKNGQSLALRVRALSLEQKDRILQECRRPNGTIDEVKQLEGTLREGILVPRFDANTAERLRHKNPEALDQVFSTIWTLSALDQDTIDAVVAAETGAPPPTNPGA